MQESYFARTGEGDMFYEFALSTTQIDAHCKAKYGVSQRRCAPDPRSLVTVIDLRLAVNLRTSVNTPVNAHAPSLFGRGWIVQQYGGIEGLKASSNIILSNGGMDPWCVAPHMSSPGAESSLGLPHAL